MSDIEYITNTEAVLASVEHTIDIANDCDQDIDLDRNGNVLTLTFENGSKIVINLQRPMQEIWVAAKVGAFHYRYVDGSWRDTKTGIEFFEALSNYVTQQSGLPILFKP